MSLRRGASLLEVERALGCALKRRQNFMLAVNKPSARGSMSLISNKIEQSLKIPVLISEKLVLELHLRIIFTGFGSSHKAQAWLGLRKWAFSTSCIDF